MATRGFEFAFMLDGTEATPVIRDLTLGETTAYKVGDAVLIQSDGYADKVVGSIGEITGVMMEAVAVGVAGTTKAKVAIATRNQVWRCSTDATTSSIVIGYTKTLDTVDCNTIDASDITNGSLTLVDTGTDDEGNQVAYVVFSDTTFGGV
jgi:hypothetical protein